jgi:hypothetical protein
MCDKRNCSKMYTAFNASGRQLENSPPIVGIQRDFIFAMTLKITKCKRLHFIFRSDGDFFLAFLSNGCLELDKKQTVFAGYCSSSITLSTC